MQDTPVPKTVDEYIASFPADIRERLVLMRDTIKKAAPGAEEKISYRMPAFTLNGMLVYYAAHTAHIGFYPFTTVLREFAEELKSFGTSKGGIRFPYKDPLPVDLIRRITEFRVSENILKASLKSSKKQAAPRKK